MVVVAALEAELAGGCRFSVFAKFLGLCFLEPTEDPSIESWVEREVRPEERRLRCGLPLLEGSATAAVLRGIWMERVEGD